MRLRHRGSIFTECEVSIAAAEHYSQCVVEVPQNFDWQTGESVVAAAVDRTSDSRPGLDAIPYAAQGSQSQAVAPVIVDAVRGGGPATGHSP